MRWQETLRDWAVYLSVQGKADRTIRQYRRTLVNFLADTGLDLFAVTEDDAVAYVASYPRNGAMRGEILRALRSFYGWASERSMCPNPVAKLKPRNPKYGRAPTLERDELTRLVIACAWREPRRAWTLLLMYATGARIGSVVAIRPEDVRGDVVEFRTAKNDSPYSVPLGYVGREAVKELLAWTPPSNRHRNRGTLVGVSEERVRQWFQQAQYDAGIRVWPHLLRHTFGTVLAEDPEIDVRTWVELMGHSDPSQFTRYAAARPERLRKAVERL